SPPSGVSGNSFLSVERGSSGPIVLTLGGFYDQDADGQFQRFLSDASKAIAKDPDRALILDLRGNPGGLDAFGVATIQLLASKPFTVYEQITATPTFDVDYVETKRLPDGTQVIMGADGQGVTPAPDVIHRGPLFVLVDQRTGSTATDVASHLDAFEGAVIIGQETIGAYNANSSGFLNLHTLKHSKAQLYLPQLRYITSAASSTRRHRGVLPDVPIDLSPEDLSSGRDAVMETARALANY
ncbi:MAG: S41 family peptidase, partial [Pseudomonadota bacterium]